MYKPRPSSLIQPPPAPVPTRPSSFILPPPNGNGSSHNLAGGAPAPGLFPTPPPFQPRKSAAGYPPVNGADANVRTGGSSAQHPAFSGSSAQHPAFNPHPAQNPDGANFTMPPGFVPERSKGGQLGPLVVAVIGIGAMILSYFAFTSFSLFK